VEWAVVGAWGCPAAATRVAAIPGAEDILVAAIPAVVAVILAVVVVVTRAAAVATPAAVAVTPCRRSQRPFAGKARFRSARPSCGRPVSVRPTNLKWRPVLQRR